MLEAHIYQGLCPDETTGAASRDPECPACRALDAASSSARHYPLPDGLYDSKDWRAADYAGRVEWLHSMYEAKKREIVSLEEMLSRATHGKEGA